MVQKGIEWINLAWDIEKLRVSLDTVMKLSFPKNAETCLTGWWLASFWGEDITWCQPLSYRPFARSSEREVAGCHVELALATASPSKFGNPNEKGLWPHSKHQTRSLSQQTGSRGTPNTIVWTVHYRYGSQDLRPSHAHQRFDVCFHSLLTHSDRLAFHRRILKEFQHLAELFLTSHSVTFNSWNAVRNTKWQRFILSSEWRE